MNTALKNATGKITLRLTGLEKITRIRIYTLFVMVLKTILFMAIIETAGVNGLKWRYVNFQFSLIYLAFIALIFSFGYLLSGKKQLWFYIFFNMAYTLMLIADLWYFRVNRDFWGFKNIIFSGTFNPLGQSLIKPQLIDILFITDIVILILWINFRGIQNNQERNPFWFKLTILMSVTYIILSCIWFNVIGLGSWDQSLFEHRWSTLMSSRASGPLGYHFFEIYDTMAQMLHKADSKETDEVKDWLAENREDLPDNKYKGLLKGKNVIFLQLESFENFIINREVNGKEITPFLNKLTREGLYFNNFYEQNNAGNSIDCDFMVNTSVLPLGEEITALVRGDDAYSKSLPRLLKSEGYTTVTSHAEEPCEFNWTELHKNGFGVDKLWDLSQYKYEEAVGYGLSDRSFLTQLAEKIKKLSGPFFLQAPTLSSHAPFNISSKYRELNLPSDIDKSYLGGYFESAHYTDRQVEMFINQLDKQGILDNSVIVIYGDHAGVHKFYEKDILNMSYEGDWWKPYDHKIPLIIYSKGMEAKTFEAAGGQIDIMPTVAYLLGIEDSKYRDSVMGRVLVNTNRDAEVIKGSVIVGQVKGEDEREHLLKAYDIGSKIIKNRYMEK